MVNCNATRTPVDTESKLGPGRDLVSNNTLYRSLAFGLQYLTFTRSNIPYIVQEICLYMHDPWEPHLAAFHRVLRYVRGTLDFGLQLYASPTLIMSVLPDDQMNSVINCLTAKSTWDDLILYHEGPSDVKESRVMDLKLCYNTFKFKEGFTNNVKDSDLAYLFGKLKYEENLIDNIYETKKKKSIVSATPLSTVFFSTSIVQDFQDSPDDEEDTRSSHDNAKATDQTECHKCGKKVNFARDCWSKNSVPSYQSPFQPKPLSSSQHKLELRPTKDFEAKYNKDEEEVSSDDNEMAEVKVLMALAEDNDTVSKGGTINSEWVKISMRKAYTLLEMEYNDDRKTYLDYLCIDLNYVEEQRNNLLSKHRDLVQDLNTCKEQLLVLKQTKLDFLTMQHCISEHIPSQKKRILRVDQLTEDPFSSGQKDLVFVKSLADDKKVSIFGVERPWLSEAEGFILPNHDTGRILPAESQRNTNHSPIALTDSSATDYDSADKSLVCSTPLPPLKKLDGAEPVSGLKTIKLILRSKSTFKPETLKDVIINKPSSALAKGNKSSSASKVNSAPAGKLKSVKIKDDPPLAIVMKELNNLKLQISKNQSSYSRNNQPHQKVLVCKKYERTDHRTCDHAEYITVHTTTDHNDIKWFRRGEALHAKKAEALKSTKAESSNANRSKTPTKSKYGVIGEDILKGTPIRCIQDFNELKDHCLTLKNTPYPHQRYAAYNTLVNEEELTGFTSIRRTHQEDTAYPCLHFTRNHDELKTYTSYPRASIRRIQVRFLVSDFQPRFIMDDSNITMEEYIKLEEEKAQRHGRTFNCLKMDSENENNKVNMSSSPGPTISHSDDLDFFKDFENEFSAITYNDDLTSKLTEPSDIDDDEINVTQSSERNAINIDTKGSDKPMKMCHDMAPLPSRDHRHPWLRMSDTKMGLDVADTLCFQLGGVRRRMTRRQFILALGLHTDEEMAEAGNAEGRTSGARLSGGHFIRCLAAYFGLVSDQGLRGLSVVTCELPLIDLHERERLNICVRVGDTWAWVALGPESTRAGTLATATYPQDYGAEDFQAQVQELRRSIVRLRGDVARLITDQGRFATWMVSCMTQLMDASGRTYHAFDSALVGSSQLPYQRRTRRRTDDANTSAPQQPDP
ncbi:retrovirus-related pol polyprotein from transposon TNT 1-94 [Tanacetum coccineum]|uniref:Retrovirus-related pol polyprotein from transposon TNT 1-94 n=1 Tax=Tanacetum coccineum TaxID=301880 RepID=A0ABQ5H1X9_9ASTR